MSAYLVSAEHIAEIVKFAHNNKFDHAYNCATRKPIDTNPKKLVALLAQANINSLVDRYGDDPKDFDGFIEECLENLEDSADGVSMVLLSKGAAYRVGRCQLKADDIFNMVNCWNYQSSEVKNWFETDAYWAGFCIQNLAARKLAENADVKWEFVNNGVTA